MVQKKSKGAQKHTDTPKLTTKNTRKFTNMAQAQAQACKPKGWMVLDTLTPPPGFESWTLIPQTIWTDRGFLLPSHSGSATVIDAIKPFVLTCGTTQIKFGPGKHVLPPFAMFATTWYLYEHNLPGAGVEFFKVDFFDSAHNTYCCRRPFEYPLVFGPVDGSTIDDTEQIVPADIDGVVGYATWEQLAKQPAFNECIVDHVVVPEICCMEIQTFDLEAIWDDPAITALFHNWDGSRWSYSVAPPIFPARVRTENVETLRGKVLERVPGAHIQVRNTYRQVPKPAEYIAERRQLFLREYDDLETIYGSHIRFIASTA